MNNNMKYIIKSTGEQVSFGDVIEITDTKETSFGTIKYSERLMLDKYNVEDLIESGILEPVKEYIKNDTRTNLGFYIEYAAKKLHLSKEALVNHLESLNKFSPKATLDILLTAISNYLYENNPKAFNEAKVYYGFKNSDGKIGKAVKYSACEPLFKSIEDASLAQALLHKQFKLVYGEQKDN